MTATILVVDDEPDLEILVQQKFRRRIRDGEFLLARGAEALDVLGNGGVGSGGPGLSRRLRQARSRRPDRDVRFCGPLGLRSDDRPVSFHLKRLLNGAVGVLIILD